MSARSLAQPRFAGMKRSLDPRMIVGMIAVTLAVGFSLFKAFSAFSAEPSSKEALPAPAFVQPAQPSLVEARFLQTQRLPTDLQVELTRRSRELASSALAAGNVRGALVAAGLRGPGLEQALESVRTARSVIVGAKGRVTSAVILDSVVDGTASLHANIVIASSDGSQLPAVGQIVLGWKANAAWSEGTLSSFYVQLSS